MIPKIVVFLVLCFVSPTISEEPDVDRLLAELGHISAHPNRNDVIALCDKHVASINTRLTMESRDRYNITLESHINTCMSKLFFSIS